MKIENLIIKHIFGIISDEENEILQHWRYESQANERLFQSICSSKDIAKGYNNYNQANKKADITFNRIWNKANLHHRHFLPEKRTWLRAAIWMLPLLMAGLVSLLYYSNNNISSIHAGTSKAILTLGNDSVILLSNSNKLCYVSTNKEYSAIEHGGKITYHFNERPTSKIFNTLSVPRGGEYVLELSDGTVVHLNSESTMQYPVCFDKRRRVVTLSGEAYFEIAKDPKRPFYVVSNGLLIRQYGTKFNVKSRTELTQVALVKGSVGVKPIHGEMQMLKPGQLACWNSKTANLVIKDKDLSSYVSWHFDRYIFDNESLKDLLQELSLWYNVDVSFKDISLGDLHFTGNFKRYDDLSIILHAVEETENVKFEIKGHQILVEKK